MSEGFETQLEQAKKSNRHQPKLKEAVSIEVVQQSLVKNFSLHKRSKSRANKETSTHRYFSDCDSCRHRRSARVGRY